jgi:hypothetical protein
MKAMTILATMLTLGLAAPVAAEPAGFVAALKGKADLRASGTRDFLGAELDQDVSEGDTLRTGRGAWAKIVLRDDTTFAVDEETELVFDRYVIGSLASGGAPSRVEVLRGHVRTKIGESFGNSTRLRLQTPTAVIGVKGTEWLTWVEIDDTWVCVIEGVVDAANRDPAIAGSMDVKPGQCARISRNEVPMLAPQPEHLKPTAMRLQAVPTTAIFPASLERTDRTPIESNDIKPRIDIPEPPPVRTFDPPPPRRIRSKPAPPPITTVP